MGNAGRSAEDLGAQLLQRAGLRVVARNWRCRHGEIDIIAADGDTLVFVEVRLRSDGARGGAGESITAVKRARIVAAARQYLARRPETACRFDALLMQRLDARAIEWVRDAFGES